LFISNVLQAQINSENGYGITTNGTIRALIVFAEKDYSLSCGNGDPYPINPEWLPGQLPNNAANI